MKYECNRVGFFAALVGSMLDYPFFSQASSSFARFTGFCEMFTVGNHGTRLVLGIGPERWLVLQMVVV
jgi:hypothetical protein